MITDNELKEIFSNAPVEKDMFEVVELTASWFSQSYYVQNTFIDGIDVPLEDGVTIVTAEYAPMQIGQAGNNTDMVYSRSVTLQYVNDIIAAEMTNRDPENPEKPKLKFRGYVMYRDGTVSSLKTPVITTELIQTNRDGVGTTMDTSVKPVNNTATGEVATVTRVPMLRGFL